MSHLDPTDTEATTLAQEFILHGDQVRAFRVVYPDSEASEKSQWEAASRMFKSSKVQARIEELNKLSKKNSEEEFTMTVSTLKKVLAKVIEKGLGGKKEEETIPLNLSSVVAAVREINSMDGNHSDVKLKITTEFIDTGEEEW